MDTNDLKKLIKPFFWIEHKESVSVCLNVGEYKTEIFLEREKEGFEGNGYDWESLAKVFLKEQQPELIDVVKFDSEAGMFCAYSSNKDALKAFIIEFKHTLENKVIILDLFSRAKLD